MIQAHAFATLFMTGVIWMVQLCHYPLFRQVGPEQFGAFHREHIRRIGWVVGPTMLVEMIAAVWLALSPPPHVGLLGTRLGLLLLVSIWLATALIQVPQHRALERGRSRAVLDRLVRWNWIRTALWSLRAGLVLSWLGQTTL